MQKIKMSLIMLLGFILFMSMDSVTAQEILERVQDKDIFFSTEEDFIAEIPGAIPIISDGDLLNSAGYVYMRNLELLRQFNVSFDLGLDAADVINITDRIVAFSTELDHPARMFTAGDLLATNGAILPNVALLVAFNLPRDLDLGLDAVHFKGSQDSVIYFLDVVKKMGRKYWLQNPLMLIRYLKKYGIDIWFSTEGTPPDRRRPRFLDGDLLSAASGTILLSNHDALPITVPAGIPQRGVDFGMDAVTVSRGQPGLIQPRCVDFEDLPLGKEYRVGDVFTDSDVTITVQRFQWSNGQWTNNGFTKVENAGRAGGTGQDMQVNNVNLDFNFGCTCDSLSLLFGEYGGNLNIRINGDFKNFQNFVDIHGTTIGGVHVSVSNGLGNDKGKLFLLGKIKSFAIGGQELWIDHVCCYCPSDNGRILFSTEIKGKNPPFTDGDVIRSGNGVAIPHFDLIQNFKPKAKFLGLDALSIHLAEVTPPCEAVIIRVGGMAVGSINSDGLANGWSATTPSFEAFDSPFGRWVEILGRMPSCEMCDSFKVEYGKWINLTTPPTMFHALTDPFKEWVLSGLLFIHVNRVPTSDGWLEVLCNTIMGGLYFPWNTTGKDGKYSLRLTIKDNGGVEYVSSPVVVMLDNTRPDTLLVIDKWPKCGDITIGNTITGKITATDQHFYSYRLRYESSLASGLILPIQKYTGVGDTGYTNVSFSWNTTGLPPCGYRIILEVWDRTIIDNHRVWGEPGYGWRQRSQFYFCLETAN